MTITGKYSCPHCKAPLINDLADWNEIKYENCPKCGKSHIIPPVNLRASKKKEGLAQLTICPACLSYDNYQCSLNYQTVKCKKCSTEILIDNFDKQINFANQYYDSMAKGVVPINISNTDNIRTASVKKVCDRPVAANLLGKSYDLSLLLNNPFWLLEVPPGANRNETLKKRERLLQRLNRPGYCCTPAVRLGESTQTNYYSKDAQNVKTVLKLLDNRQEYLIYSLFWPGVNGPPLSVDYLFELAIGNESEYPLQSRAAAWLIIATAKEWDYLADAISKPPEKEWENALNLWNELLMDKAFLSHIQSHVQSLIGLPENSAKRMVEEDIPNFTLGIISCFINEYTAAGKIQDVRRLILIGNNNEFPPAVSNQWLFNTLESLTKVKIEALVSRAKVNFEKDGKHLKQVNHQIFAARFDAILDEAENIIAYLRESLIIEEVLINSLYFDDLALAILEKAEKLDCKAENPDYTRNRFQIIITLERSKQLPLKRHIRMELENMIKKTLQELYPFGNKKLDSLGKCWFIQGERASAADSLIFDVHKMTSMEIDGSYRYQKKQVIVPRSKLAKDLHNGVNKKNILKTHLRSPAVQKQLSANTQNSRKKFGKMCKAVEKLVLDLNNTIAKSSIETHNKYPAQNDLQDLERKRDQALDVCEEKYKNAMAEHASKWNKASLWRWRLKVQLPLVCGAFAAPFILINSPSLSLIISSVAISGVVTHKIIRKKWHNARNIHEQNIIREYAKEKSIAEQNCEQQKKLLLDSFNRAHYKYSDYLKEWKKQLDTEFSEANATGLNFTGLAKPQSTAQTSPFYLMFKNEGYQDGKKPSDTVVNNALRTRIRNATHRELISFANRIGINGEMIGILGTEKIKSILVDAFCK